jgi:5-hydroxyisourate hydrolase
MARLVSGITSHVLDTSRGKPAAGLTLRLERVAGDGIFETLTTQTTNADGRVPNLLPTPAPGVYRLVFATGAYFAAVQSPCFYPEVTVLFRLEDVAQHYHVPLLLSPFGYSTYRGS